MIPTSGDTSIFLDEFFRGDCYLFLRGRPGEERGCVRGIFRGL